MHQGRVAGEERGAVPSEGEVEAAQGLARTGVAGDEHSQVQPLRAGTRNRVGHRRCRARQPAAPGLRQGERRDVVARIEHARCVDQRGHGAVGRRRPRAGWGCAGDRGEAAGDVAEQAGQQQPVGLDHWRRAEQRQRPGSLRMAAVRHDQDRHDRHAPAPSMEIRKVERRTLDRRPVRHTEPGRVHDDAEREHRAWGDDNRIDAAAQAQQPVVQQHRPPIRTRHRGQSVAQQFSGLGTCSSQERWHAASPCFVEARYQSLGHAANIAGDS